VEEFSDPRVVYSGYTGSARRLADGHWLVQWGGATFMTELDATATPVLTIDYNVGTGFSYRAVPVAAGLIDAAVLRAGMDAMAD